MESKTLIVLFYRELLADQSALRPGRGRNLKTQEGEALKSETVFWKRLKGKNMEGNNFRKLLRRKQSSAKISRISRNRSDIFYLMRNLLKYLPRTIFLSVATPAEPRGEENFFCAKFGQ